jgi:hypothetical protein
MANIKPTQKWLRMFKEGDNTIIQVDQFNIPENTYLAVTKHAGEPVAADNKKPTVDNLTIGEVLYGDMTKLQAAPENKWIRSITTDKGVCRPLRKAELKCVYGPPPTEQVTHTFGEGDDAIVVPLYPSSYLNQDGTVVPAKGKRKRSSTKEEEKKKKKATKKSHKKTKKKAKKETKAASPDPDNEDDDETRQKKKAKPAPIKMAKSVPNTKPKKPKKRPAADLSESPPPSPAKDESAKGSSDSDAPDDSSGEESSSKKQKTGEDDEKEESSVVFAGYEL